MINRQKRRTLYDDLSIIAKGIWRITEDGRLLRNEGVYIYYLEKCGICKVKKDGVYIYVQKKENSMVELDSNQIMLYVITFLKHLGLSDVIEFLLDNNLFFSPEILDALKEEAPVAVFDNLVELYTENGIVVTTEDQWILESLYLEQ